MSNVQSVERTFTILESVSTTADGLTATQIAQLVDLPKSTVARLLLTLEGEEAVERVPGTRRYRIGPRTIALVSGIPFPEYLRFLARPYLLKLTEATGEATTLCLLNDNQTVVADSVQSQHLVHVQDAIGKNFPLHTTSSGMVMLAFWPENRLEQYLSQLPQLPTTDPDVLSRQLVDIRKNGYAWTHKEIDKISGISAPIWYQTDMVMAVINLYGPSFRFPPADQRDDITRMVIETAQNISNCLQENPR
jgi:DNA-binding IclR family transcriptional regulator